MLRIVDNTQNL